MVVLLNVIILTVCMFVNYKLAQKQGRSVIWALIWGLLFSFFSTIVYLIIGNKK